AVLRNLRVSEVWELAVPRRRNVGTHPLAAFRIGTADEALAGDDRAESIARAVTLGAMAWSIDEIRAAIPLVRLGGIGLEPLPVEKKEFPAAEHAADLEIERQVVLARLAFHRRQRLEIGKKIAHVFHLHALVGGVGEKRIVVAAVGGGGPSRGGGEVWFTHAAE